MLNNVSYFSQGQILTMPIVRVCSLPYYFIRYLPREVDPMVYNMSHEDPGNVSYSAIGGLSEQIRELREVRNKLESLLDSFDDKPSVECVSSMVPTPF